MSNNLTPVATIIRRSQLTVLLERHGSKCQHCGRTVRTLRGSRRKKRRLPDDLATVDHITPQSRGGSDELDNLTLSCRACNMERGDLDIDVFHARRIRGGGAS